MQLSALTSGKVFVFVNGTVNYLKTDYTGTSVSKLVVYNLKTCGFEEYDETTLVTEGTLTTTSLPTFVVG